MNALVLLLDCLSLFTAVPLETFVSVTAREVSGPGVQRAALTLQFVVFVKAAN